MMSKSERRSIIKEIIDSGVCEVRIRGRYIPAKVTHLYRYYIDIVTETGERYNWSRNKLPEYLLTGALRSLGG